MSDLVYQNYNNKCQGWTNPTNTIFGPQINNLSGYYSPAGSTTLVSISGSGFYSYSVVAFGTYNPTSYFINSNIIQFYVPSSLNSGTYPVQIYNGSIGSNIVNYTIDNASGYWLLESSGSITNTNTANSWLVSVSSLSRGAPIIITNQSTDIVNNTYTVPKNVNWIICNYSSANSLVISLPAGTEFTGREITLKNFQPNQVTSNATNIINDINSQAISQILPAATSSETSSFYPWATLVYNGSNWYIMQSNF